MKNYEEEYNLYNASIAPERVKEIEKLILESDKRGIYERTTEWRTRCKIKKQIANYKCEECKKKKKSLHVHHKTYERYGNENHEDLKILCQPCHANFHKIYPHHNRHFAVNKIEQKTGMDYLPMDFIN